MSDTREKLLSVSLELFSLHGYEAVSIRDICAQVGIKESSVYYHFQNKQAILDELLARFEQRSLELMSGLSSVMDEGQIPDEKGFEAVCSHFFDGYLAEPFCNSVLRLLSMEQYHSPKARSLYRRWLFDEPLAYQTRVFAALTGRADASYLAVKFYSPIFLYAQRWLLCGRLSDGDRAAFRADAYRHVRRFVTELGAR